MKLKVHGDNQTEVELNDNIIVFFSYNTPVAAVITNPKTGKYEFYRTETTWSKTTQKHINQFKKNWWVGLATTFKPQEFFDNLLLTLKIEKL